MWMFFLSPSRWVIDKTPTKRIEFIRDVSYRCCQKYDLLFDLKG